MFSRSGIRDNKTLQNKFIITRGLSPIPVLRCYETEHRQMDDKEYRFRERSIVFTIESYLKNLKYMRNREYWDLNRQFREFAAHGVGNSSTEIRKVLGVLDRLFFNRALESVKSIRWSSDDKFNQTLGITGFRYIPQGDVKS